MSSRKSTRGIGRGRGRGRGGSRGRGLARPSMTVTTKGALTFVASGDPLVDLYFHTVRGLSTDRLHSLLKAAWSTARLTPSDVKGDAVSDQHGLAKARTLTLRAILHLRDIRHKGKGERDLFISAFKWLALADLPSALRLLKEGFISEYGCNRDLGVLARLRDESKIPNPNIVAIRRTAVQVMVTQLHKDLSLLRTSKGKPAISLMAKWVPRRQSKRDKSAREDDQKGCGLYSQIAAAFGSYNARLPKDQQLTKADASLIGGSQHDFRSFVLVPLTKHLKVVETLMSSGKWEEIDFNHVPSKAALRYKAAFTKHRPETKDGAPGYQDWVKEAKTNAEKKEKGVDVKKGSAKINTAAVHPHEILKPYMGYVGQDFKTDREGYDWTRDRRYDTTVEAAWAQFRSKMRESMKDRFALAVADVSGSMESGSHPSAIPMHISVTLACLFAELAPAPWRGRWLNFSTSPSWELMTMERDGQPTTLLERICTMDTQNWMQSTNLQALMDMVLILYTGMKNTDIKMPGVLCIISDMQFDQACPSNTLTNFEATVAKFKQADVPMPQVVFWNVNSKEDVPVTFNQAGVALVSGFSPQVMEQVLACDPETLKPYKFVEQVLTAPDFRNILWQASKQVSGKDKPNPKQPVESLPLPEE